MKIDLSLLGVVQNDMMLKKEIVVKEKIVLIDGIKYMQTKYQAKIFYVRLLKPLEETGYSKNGRQVEGFCFDGTKLKKFPPHRINLDFGDYKEVKKTRLFIRSLQFCRKIGSIKRLFQILKKPDIGIRLPENKNSRFKNKEIYYAPKTNGLYFKGSF